VKKWLESRQPETEPTGARSIDEIHEEVLATIAEETEASMLVFQRLDGHLVMRAGTVRAHIKDCARVMSAQYIGRANQTSTRAFSTRVINGVYLPNDTYWVPLLSNGERLTEPSGARDKPVHVRGPKGMTNALKRFEYVMPPVSMEFDLAVLGESVSENDLRLVFDYGGVHGYGGERSDGEGRYAYTLERISPKKKRAKGANG
jgi:hypothetical protein